MNAFSMTTSGIAVAAFLMLADHFGVQFADGELQAWLVTTGKLLSLLGALLALAVAWYGRWRKGDITIFGKRK